VFLFRARLFHFITELSEHDAAREDLLITFNDPRACMQSNADLISIEKNDVSITTGTKTQNWPKQRTEVETVFLKIFIHYQLSKKSRAIAGSTARCRCIHFNTYRILQRHRMVSHFMAFLLVFVCIKK